MDSHVNLLQIVLWIVACLTELPLDFVAALEEREIESVITGTKYSGGNGSFTAPSSYPDGGYTRDATSYVFILENVAVEGSVEISIEHFNIHPDSWITVRNSKYGGYIGRMIGRYDQRNRPPRVILTDTCCLRIEFQTGCCDPDSAGFTGFKATYRFTITKGKGRRTTCPDRVYNQLCNGECIPEVHGCPCPQYGQYKCENGMCIAREAVCDGVEDCVDSSDEHLCVYGDANNPLEGLGPMFTFAVVITTICSILGGVFILFCILSTVDKFRKRKLKKMLKDSSTNGAVAGKGQIRVCPKHGPIIVAGPHVRPLETVVKASSNKGIKPVSVTVSPIHTAQEKLPMYSAPVFLTPGLADSKPGSNTPDGPSSTYRAFSPVDDTSLSSQKDPPLIYTPYGAPVDVNDLNGGRYCFPRRPVSEDLSSPFVQKPIAVKLGSVSAPSSPSNEVKLQRVNPQRARIFPPEENAQIQGPVPGRQARRIADPRSSTGSDVMGTRTDDPWVKGPEQRPTPSVGEILAMETNVDGYIAKNS